MGPLLKLGSALGGDYFTRHGKGEIILESGTIDSGGDVSTYQEYK